MAYISVKIKSILKGSKLGTYLRRKNWNKGIINETRINKTIDKYMGEIPLEQKSALKNDILDMAKKYRFTAEEYFCYHFMDKPEDERKTFIFDLNRIDFCETLNKAKNLAIFDDKFKSAEVFSKYYGRDVCGVKSIKDYRILEAFAKKHKKFMIKPLTGTCGKGIKIFEKDWNEAELKALIYEYCSGTNDGFIAEELVVQDPLMAQFHPSSLNTIRIATIRYNEGAEVIASFFRTGRGGSIVDNAGAGGVFGTIDIETGIIDAVGDEYGNSYEIHPDTHIKMTGFAIPRWQEAVDMAKELAMLVEGNRYSGWDLALTEKGWVMIEGNARGQFVWQMPRQKGFLAEANQILKRLGLPPMSKLSI